MKQSFPYIPSAGETSLVYTDGDIMEQAVEAFENHNYIESLHLLIDALDEEFREIYGNAQGTFFKIPHGSIVVNISITPDKLRISADFLKLPEQGRVAMLRQIAEMNDRCLLLPRFVKVGDYLQIEYSCAITDTHPHKIHSVLRNICTVGDQYDDELCTRFDAERCYTPKVTPYAKEEIDEVYEGLHTVGQLALEASADFCAQRRYGYALTVLDGAIQQFLFFANPQGQLINEIEKVQNMLDEERPLDELVMRATDFINKLLSFSKEDLAKDLYNVELMMSMKPHVTLQGVQDDFEDIHDELTGAMQKHGYEHVVVRLYHSFYRLLAQNNLPFLVEYTIITALRESESLPVKEAAEILFKALDDIMAGNIEISQGHDEEADDDEEADLVEDNTLDAEAVATAHANVVATQQKIADAMNGGEIAEYQRLMDEALKAGDRDEYLRLATAMQVYILKMMGS